MIVAPVTTVLGFIILVTLLIVCCVCLPQYRLNKALRKGQQSQGEYDELKIIINTDNLDTVCFADIVT